MPPIGGSKWKANGPPAANVVELKPGGERRGEDEPEQRVEEDLPRVEHAGLLGRAKAMLDPVQLQQLHALEERNVFELVEVDVG